MLSNCYLSLCCAEYPWAEAIALFMILTTFCLEYLAGEIIKARVLGSDPKPIAAAGPVRAPSVCLVHQTSVPRQHASQDHVLRSVPRFR